MDHLDSWIGRREYGLFHRSGLFDSEVYVHSVVETEYQEGYWGYEFSRQIGWLAEENTGTLTKREYSAFIADLRSAYNSGNYIFQNRIIFIKELKSPRTN